MMEMDEPRFYEVTSAGTVYALAHVVVHKNADGEVFCFHSPLERSPVHCDLCETPGTRVYLEEQR